MFQQQGTSSQQELADILLNDGWEEIPVDRSVVISDLRGSTAVIIQDPVTKATIAGILHDQIEDPDDTLFNMLRRLRDLITEDNFNRCNVWVAGNSPATRGEVEKEVEDWEPEDKEFFAEVMETFFEEVGDEEDIEDILDTSETRPKFIAELQEYEFQLGKIAVRWGEKGESLTVRFVSSSGEFSVKDSETGTFSVLNHPGHEHSAEMKTEALPPTKAVPDVPKAAPRRLKGGIPRLFEGMKLPSNR